MKRPLQLCHDNRQATCVSNRLGALIAASPLPIVGIGPDGRVLSWSQAAERVFGWSSLEAMGHYLPCLPGDSANELSELRSRIQSAQPFIDYQAVRRRKDGTRLEVSVSTSPMYDEAGHFLGIVAVYEDLTRRRETERALRASEEQLRQAQKMEAIGLLAGGVAHDFNNILTAIQSYSGIIAEDLPPDSSLLADVAEIQAAATRAASLTRQLLAFSRKQELTLDVLDLNTIVTETERMLQRVIGEDIELTTHLAPDLWRVRTDAGQLGQVLLNLAVNARDAMPGGGRLAIATRNVALTGATGEPAGLCRGSYVHLAVSDTGAGMSPATRDRIFEPFFTTKGPGKGTGLGLAMVYGFVRQSGGMIAVESELGHGSLFSIWLPRHLAAAPSAPPSKAGLTEGPVPSATILLLEDDSTVRSVARRALLRAGHHVIEAGTGVEALDSAEITATPVDLVIVDAVLPGMSGSDFVARFRQNHPEAAVVMMSGYTEEAANRVALHAQCDVFLDKPFNAEQLVNTVSAALRSRYKLCPLSR